MFVWIYENCAKELKSCPKQAFFSSPETIFKGDDTKIKRKVSPFFSSSTRLSSFHCCPFSIFARLCGLEVA